METIVYIFAKAVEIMLSLISLGMLLRVLLQFFVNVEENNFYAFCVMVTEPFIFPFRLILSKLNIGQDSPFDFAFLFAYFALTALSMFLPVI